jgi:hypothetical protein
MPELSGAEMRALGGDPFNMTVAGLRLPASERSRRPRRDARAMWARPGRGADRGDHERRMLRPGSRPRSATRSTILRRQGGARMPQAQLLAELERRHSLAFDPESP